MTDLRHLLRGIWDIWDLFVQRGERKKKKKIIADLDKSRLHKAAAAANGIYSVQHYALLVKQLPLAAHKNPWFVGQGRSEVPYVGEGRGVGGG